MMKRKSFLVLALIIWSTLLLIIIAVDQNKEAHDENIIQMAREFRDGTQRLEKNLARAVHFYQYAIEKTKGKVLNDALNELSVLLEENPDLSSKYSSWDLTVASAAAGNEYAAHRLSLSYASGIYADGLVPMDATKALLLEHMSALSGNPEAAIGMGYRYLNGVGVPESCERALPFYEYAANYAARYIEKRNGYIPYQDRTHLSDSTDAHLKLLKAESTSELMDYYSHLAENGDSAAANLLGNIYATGSRHVDSDETKAIHFLSLATKLKHAHSGGLLGYILAKKYRRLQLTGKIHEGEDQEEENTTLKKIVDLLTAAVKTADPNAYVGMGYITQFGIGAEVNQSKAMEYFNKALPSHPDAGFYIGEIVMKTRVKYMDGQTNHQQHVPQEQLQALRGQDFASAAHAYSSSTQLGHVLSQHRIAHLSSRGYGTPQSCDNAVYHFKNVAEKGEWSTKFNEAMRLYQERKYSQALYLFSTLAVIGYEAAQYNAAYILFRHYCPKPRQAPNEINILFPRLLVASDISDLSTSKINATFAAIISKKKWSSLLSTLTVDAEEISPSTAVDKVITFSIFNITMPLQTSSMKNRGKVECDARALALFSLSAAQGNSEAYVQIGDFYYYGLASFNRSRPLAATYYQRAADLHNTQAIFNLGLMHEIGDGVNQDFHLAKRYYDLAAEIDPKARTPRDIALTMMEGHKNAIIFFESEMVRSFFNRTGLEKVILDYTEQLSTLVCQVDQIIRSLIDQILESINNYFKRRTEKMKEYIPEKTRFQLIETNDKIQAVYETSKQIVTAWKNFLKEKVRMKEEESVLFLTLSFILLVLFSFQLILFGLPARNH